MRWSGSWWLSSLEISAEVCSGTFTEETMKMEAAAPTTSRSDSLEAGGGRIRPGLETLAMTRWCCSPFVDSPSRMFSVCFIRSGNLRDSSTDSSIYPFDKKREEESSLELTWKDRRRTTPSAAFSNTSIMVPDILIHGWAIAFLPQAKDRIDALNPANARLC